MEGGSGSGPRWWRMEEEAGSEVERGAEKREREKKRKKKKRNWLEAGAIGRDGPLTGGAFLLKLDASTKYLGNLGRGWVKTWKEKVEKIREKEILEIYSST